MHKPRISPKSARLLGLTIVLLTIKEPSFSQFALSNRTSEPTINGLSTHGTVNIILANKNGLIAVSDSMLSAGGRPVDQNQKLFQVDDHTILLIAGWYSDAGRTVGGQFHPNYTAIPQVIGIYIQAAGARLAKDTIEQKANDLSAIFTFILQVLADNDATDGIGFNPSKSELTLAGYDGGILKILQLDLVPYHEPRVPVVAIDVPPGTITSGVRYKEENRSTLSISKNLHFIVRGIEGPSRAVLEHSSAFASGESALAHYSSGMSHNKGKSLSLDEMIQVALSLKTRTEKCYPNAVGGPPQIATLRNGSVSSVSQPFAHNLTSDIQPTIIRGMEHLKMPNPEHLKGVIPIATVYPTGALVTDSEFSDFRTQYSMGPGVKPSDLLFMHLDQFIYVRTKFQNMALIYEGSPAAVFDRSNEVSPDSILQLGGSARRDSPLVKQIRHDFPNLEILDACHVTAEDWEKTPCGNYLFPEPSTEKTP